MEMKIDFKAKVQLPDDKIVYPNIDFSKLKIVDIFPAELNFPEDDIYDLDDDLYEAVG